ncbi:hypothetical protein J6G99_06455 [bacterium]|nr:hypothetical protein [bacterium]
MYNNTNSDINECTSRGVCSIPPNISALQELLLFFIKQTAFYIVELKKLGVNNSEIKEKIISDLASIVSISEFNEKQLYQLVYDNFCMLKNAKLKYISRTKETNTESVELEIPFELEDHTSLPKAISQGEKIFFINYKKYNQNQRNLFEILNVVLKSVCLNIKKIQEYEKNQNINIYKVIEALYIYNENDVSVNEIQQEIEKLSVLNSQLLLDLSYKLTSRFGDMSYVKVSHSTTKGKAILVSGNNFFDLINVLESVKNTEIDVYTHSGLLICHSLKKFQEYKNLKGHYGNSTESCILDFATFPGAILLTKNSKNGTEYLYRGKIFSNDYVVPQGVIKIENNDFTDLIESAKYLKGFKKGKKKESSFVGYNENELETKLKYIISKIKSGVIKKLYLIGTNSYSEIQKEYFYKFFSDLKYNEFAIDFSYNKQQKNVLSLNIGDYVPLAIRLLNKLLSEKDIINNMYFFFTKCDSLTISEIIWLKSLGVNNIYMSKCSPVLLNPAVLDCFLFKYNVKITNNAILDLKEIRTFRKK